MCISSANVQSCCALAECVNGTMYLWMCTFAVTSMVTTISGGLEHGWNGTTVTSLCSGHKFSIHWEWPVFILPALSVRHKCMVQMWGLLVETRCTPEGTGIV